MGHMKNSALWSSLEDFLQRYAHEHEGKEIIRLVGELRMGGRLNGGDILYLKEIIKQSRVGGLKAAKRLYEEEQITAKRLYEEEQITEKK